ncbi:MAG: VWA domain-containing protein [Bryobacterales bacterium]|nr:VWA domain-containing protein [Bryobacterales bacterium]
MLAWTSSRPAVAQSLEASAVQTDVDFSSEVRLVQINATVSDGKRKYVRGLTAENFRIFDNGEPRKISAFEADNSGFSCALLLDSTGSMKRVLPTLKRALLEFIDSLRTNDAVAVYAFSTQLEHLQELTLDKDEVKRAVLMTRAAGATALFDSIYRVVNDLNAIDGKKALLVFTDGDDNASVLNARSAVRQAREIGVPVFAAAQGGALENKDLLKQIRELAESTGGLAFEMRKSGQAKKIFRVISDSLKHGYLLAFHAPQVSARHWRRIQVTVPSVKRARVRAKTGYQAMP